MSYQILTFLITTLLTSEDLCSPLYSAFVIWTSGRTNCREANHPMIDCFLYFSYNHLEKIQSFTFGKIPTLLDVDLSHNRIVDIRRGAFGNLVSIRSLYLDHNMLDEIPRPPISLNHLHMSHNKVRWENNLCQVCQVLASPRWKIRHFYIKLFKCLTQVELQLTQLWVV